MTEIFSGVLRFALSSIVAQRVYWVSHRSPHPSMLNIKSCLAQGHSSTNSLRYLVEKKCLFPPSRIRYSNQLADCIWPRARNILKWKSWFVAQIIQGGIFKDIWPLCAEAFSQDQEGSQGGGRGRGGWGAGRGRVGWPLIPLSTLALH